MSTYYDLWTSQVTGDGDLQMTHDSSSVDSSPSLALSHLHSTHRPKVKKEIGCILKVRHDFSIP